MTRPVAAPLFHQLHHLGGGTLCEGFGVEHFRQAGLHAGQLLPAKAAQVAVVGQHHEAGVIEGDERHHHVVVGQRRPVGSLGVAGNLVLAGGLVAVMPVGQEHRARREKAGDGCHVVAVGDAP